MSKAEYDYLGNYAKIRRGASPRPIDDPKYFANEGRGWIRISDVSSSKKYLKKTSQYLSGLGVNNSVCVDKGDLILSICGSIGIPIIIDIPACIHDGFVFIYDTHGLEKEYLYYFLQSVKDGWVKYGQSGTQTNLNTDLVRKLPIFLPDKIEYQITISQILDTLDNLIFQTEAMIEKLSNIKTGLMQDLLTKGIDENGEIRDPIKYPERFKDSRLGKIPKDWNVKSIEDLTCHVGSGVTPKGGSEVYEKQGILFIRSQNVIFDGLLFEDIAYISQKIHNQMSRSQLCPFDVLLNITGASIGRCCVFPDNLGEANVNQHVCTIRLKNIDVNKACFLSSFLSSDYGQNQIYCLNAGGNREGLNYQQVRSFLIPWAESEAEFSEIRERIIKSNESIRSERRHAQKLKLLKQGLMQDLLTGKVSVTGAVEKPAKTA